MCHIVSYVLKGVLSLYGVIVELSNIDTSALLSEAMYFWSTLSQNQDHCREQKRGQFRAFLI